MRASLDLQLEHMKLTAYFPVSRFVSFDGMDNGPHKFKNNSCWGPVGIAAETKQYQIDTRFFFLSWLLIPTMDNRMMTGLLQTPLAFLMRLLLVTLKTIHKEE